MGSTTINADAPFVLIRLKGQLYGISAAEVREMTQFAQVSRVPKVPAYIRGVMNLRGQVLVVLDLRMRLGLPPASVETEELIELLQKRKADHKNWIIELEKSVDEGREFKLATDPHQCAFGKWYDHFKTDNVVLSSTLRKFDKPHKQIHGIAHQVETLKKEGKLDQARQLIEITRNTDLTYMIELFDHFQEQLREGMRDIAVVLKTSGKIFAVIADSVESVEQFPAGLEEVPAGLDKRQDEFLRGIGRRQKDGQLVMILKAENLMGEMVAPKVAQAEG